MDKASCNSFLEGLEYLSTLFYYFLHIKK